MTGQSKNDATKLMSNNFFEALFFVNNITRIGVKNTESKNHDQKFIRTNNHPPSIRENNDLPKLVPSTKTELKMK